MTQTTVIFYDPTPVIDAALMSAINKQLAQMTAQAKSLCHVGNYREGSGEVGGRLRNSIMYRSYTAKGGFNDKPGASATSEITVNPKPLEGYFGTNVSYAVYEEYGTRYRGAHPYLRPAIALYAYGQGREYVKQQLAIAMAGKTFKESSRAVFY